jgi:hypothetical protein
MYQPIQMDDKTSTLLVSVIGALTVLISQIGSFMYGDPKSDTSDSNDEKKEEVNNELNKNN